MRIISHYTSKDIKWFRLFGYGLSFTSVNTKWVPFSIRNGNKKTTKLFGHYVQFLKK
jgi:hypothetical protein